MMNPIQFFSKTWIGNANLLLKRGQRLKPPLKDCLIEILKTINPDICLVTGDFTTTSQKNEFTKALDFLEHLKSAGFKVLAIPGNHDHYTKKAFNKKIFYSFLKNQQKPDFGDLKTLGIEIFSYSKDALVLLDLTKATPWFTAYGVYNHRLEESLLLNQDLLADKKVIVAGHFPLFKNDLSFHHALKKGSQFFETLKKINAHYYLHGHNHNFNILKKDSLVQIDSGSISDIHKGSFVVLDTELDTITPFFRKEGQFIKGQHYAR